MEKADLSVYRSLNRHKVKYVLIGGMAAILYGSPRITKDTDILIEATLENCQRLLQALKEANFGTAGLTTAQKILKNEVSIFKDYVRLDVLVKSKGLRFEEVWRNKKIKRIKGVAIPTVSLSDLILLKKAAGREIDIEDIKILKKIKQLK